MSDQRVEESASEVLAAEVFGVPAPDPVIRLQAAPPTDVLAAEEFGVPAPYPAFRLQVGPAIDVLAAEEFGMPAPDPRLHQEHLALPEDLVGGEPRDVLAAEEFAMPAPDEAHVVRPAGRRRMPTVRFAVINLPLLLSAVLVFRWLRRRRSGS
jgi:hypothetical protein